nr:activating signal cointegrator 1 complex subunit 2-like [Ciona intestinalis]|eukprot:XP_009859398.1 activating signal cointegrator 1 complex subunit 2-like [Ciona intestinalis]
MEEVPYLNESLDKVELRPAIHKDLCKYRLSGELYENLDENNLSKVETIIDDLQWLLSLNHPKFWCQVINDETVSATLSSYLQFAPRFHNPSWSDEIKKKHDQLHRLFFMTFLRLSTPKESENSFFSPSEFGRIIYENFIFDIPSLMDIACLFGNQTNHPLLHKMFESIFNNQPLYNNDLEEAAKMMVKILQEFDGKFVKQTTTKRKLIDRSGIPHSKDELLELASYLFNSLYTLDAFMQVYPEGCHAFYKINTIEVLCQLYNGALVIMKEQTQNNALPLDDDFFKLRTFLLKSKELVLSLLHRVVVKCAYKPAVEASRNKTSDCTVLCENYLEILSAFASDHNIINDLDEKFGLREDINNLVRVNEEINESQVSFLLDTIQPSPCQPPHEVSTEVDAISAWREQFTSSSLTNGDSGGIETAQSFENQNSFVNATDQDDIEAVSLISSVQDILPDLGAGFIRACLEEFSNNPEMVIQRVLEDNLPSHIAAMDRTTQSFTKPTANLNHEENLNEFGSFDPEFDDQIFEMPRKKKFTEYKAYKAQEISLADEGKLVELYSKYGVVYDGEENQETTECSYEDEYDDTYDGIQVGANDADETDDLVVEHQTTRDLWKYKQTNDDENEEGEKKDRLKDFVRNPEEVRAFNQMREESRRRFRGGGGSRGGSGRGARGGGASGSRGGGRGKDKSSRGNHNRKKLATKKASQGM